MYVYRIKKDGLLRGTFAQKTVLAACIILILSCLNVL